MSRSRRLSPQDEQDLFASGITTKTDGSVVSLFVGGTEQSRVDLAKPHRLEFEYMEQMNVVVQSLLPEPEPLRALHIGGGGCALALAWDLRRPNSRQLAVEADPEMARTARELFPLPRKPRLRIRVADGAQALAGSNAQFQVIVRDAFLGPDVPAHLTGLQWVGDVASHLQGDGIYLANSSHGATYSARPDVAATATTFARTLVIGESKVLKGARKGNVVIVAWNTPGLLESGEIDRRLRRLPLPVSVLQGKRLQNWLGGTRPDADKKGPA